MDKLEQYIEQYSAAEDPLLTELDRVTNQRVIQPKMVSGRVQGAFMKLITQMFQPKLVLEIGTFTGYSALAIAAGMGDYARLESQLASEQEQGLQSAELHTIEIDDELEDLVRSFFERSPHGHKIHLHIGAALEVVPCLARSLGRPFDMVFIDGDKREYPDYWRMLMGDGAVGKGEETANGSPMVRSGGIILADNVLWYGKVAEPEAVKSADRMSQGILEFNRLVAADPRVENVILPLRDGINLIRVK